METYRLFQIEQGLIGPADRPPYVCRYNVVAATEYMAIAALKERLSNTRTIGRPRVIASLLVDRILIEPGATTAADIRYGEMRLLPPDGAIAVDGWSDL